MAVSLDTYVQFAVPPAFVVSLALRWVYLRVVRRSMLRAGGTAPRQDDVHAAPARAAAPPAQPLAIVSVDPAARDAVRDVWRGPNAAAAVHTVAGAAYAVAMALIWLWVTGSGYDWAVMLFFALFYIWPLVIVIALVANLSWRAIGALGLIYAVLLQAGAAWLTRGTTITWDQFALMWWNFNGIPTLLVLGSLARPIKAMGPIMVALMVAAAAGVFGMADLLSGQESVLLFVAWIATSLGFSGEAGGIAAGVIALALAAVVAAVFAYVALRVAGRLYRARWISDQSIQLDAVWLIFAIAHAPASEELLGLTPFLAYKLVAVLGLRLVRFRRATADQPRLLLLRVFSLGARSENLFRAFSLLWRYIGSVRMIAGPDLANATVEPDEFLDFLAGRLQRRFITGPEVLAQRIAETEPRRDPDGRFRVSNFFCHADTWQAVLRRLARESDLVLMDLRGFTGTNKGCIYELNELLDAVPLTQLLLVVDKTTDTDFLTAVLQQGWMQIGPDSVNRTDAAPCVRLYPLDGAGSRRVDRLVATLVRAQRGALAAATA